MYNINKSSDRRVTKIEGLINLIIAGCIIPQKVWYRLEDKSMLILQGEIKKNIMIWIKAGKKLQKDNWQGICSTTGE